MTLPIRGNGKILEYLQIFINAMFANVELPVLTVNTKQMVANAKIVQLAVQMSTFLPAVHALPAQLVLLANTKQAVALELKIQSVLFVLLVHKDRKLLVDVVELKIQLVLVHQDNI